MPRVPNVDPASNAHDRFFDQTLEGMGIARLSSDQCSADVRIFRVLITPTFHDWCCITLTSLGSIGEIDYVAGRPERIAVQRRVAISTALSERICATLMALGPSTLPSADEPGGRDGMGMFGEMWEGTSVSTFRLSTTNDLTNAHASIAYTRTLLEAAVEALNEPSILQLQHNIVRYLAQPTAITPGRR